jgi:hypothetical protein
MKIHAIALIAMMFLPVSAQACDCGCTCQPLFHFKDGISPNGPSNTEAIYADPAHYGHGCGCDVFGFRDYGPARVVTPPPVDTKAMVHPSS